MLRWHKTALFKVYVGDLSFLVFDVCKLVKYNFATNISLEDTISSKTFIYFIINAGPNLLLQN